ncbi:hypothetical protein [Sphingobacterium corticibacter]|uniref:Uncharacterized protein n=1 Tax=Sphingobacterium corticibacter TaxID=2171749 RepID=A0A2T8HNK5_9SPHI|nr:hypothetical protein [Sphingobacterium corticibacter]PVH26995.1 hypothetical protein DC487_05210 [Sphingobacterium corticibacter]
MDKKVEQLLLAYAELSNEQKKDLKKGIDDYDKSNSINERRQFTERLQKSLGPLNRVCERCGR